MTVTLERKDWFPAWRPSQNLLRKVRDVRYLWGVFFSNLLELLWESLSFGNHVRLTTQEQNYRSLSYLEGSLGLDIICHLPSILLELPQVLKFFLYVFYLYSENQKQ